MPLRIIQDDITKLPVDAIVNPTNSYLWPGGGADAAIHKAAGPKLLVKCQTLGGLSVGEAKITPAFDLPAKYVIHTAGPEWIDGFHGERVLLRSCYEKAMALAAEHQCESIAFPLISSGTGGYPKEMVLHEAMDVLSECLRKWEMEVFVVLYDKEDYSIHPFLRRDIEKFLRRVYREPRRFEDIPREEANFSSFDEEGVLSCEEVEYRGIERREAPSFCGSASAAPPSLRDKLRNMDKGFAETLFALIDQKGLTDVEAYKRSNVSKKTFSKIKCTKNYRPSKITAVSFAIGLRLNLEETRHLLSTAGMCLSHSSRFDVIIEYFIVTGDYKTVFDVNEVLYQFDQALLGV